VPGWHGTGWGGWTTITRRPRHVPGAGAGSRSVDNQLWIDDASLRFEPGSFNVLLGRTLAGKTSLMRLMAGLDRPTAAAC
jgi:ABC-type multidrug transport system ATPase subunit